MEARWLLASCSFVRGMCLLAPSSGDKSRSRGVARRAVAASSGAEETFHAAEADLVPLDELIQLRCLAGVRRSRTKEEAREAHGISVDGEVVLEKQLTNRGAGTHDWACLDFCSGWLSLHQDEGMPGD